MHGHAQALWELRELRAQLDRDSRRVRQRRYLQSRRVDPQLDLQPLADPTQALQAARGQRCRSNLGTRIRRHSRRRRQASRRAFRRRNALQESASEASSSPVRPQRRPLNPVDPVTGKRRDFFDRHTRTGQKNRSGEFEDARSTRSKKIAVDAMRPAHQTNKPARVEFTPQCLSRHHHARASIVEPTKQCIDKSARRHSSRSKILGEARVVASRKGASGSAASEPCA